MTKHGVSHGSAVLVCSIASTLLVDIIRKHVPFIYGMVDKFSTFIKSTIDLKYGSENISIITYATVLAVIWGVAFALVHED